MRNTLVWLAETPTMSGGRRQATMQNCPPDYCLPHGPPGASCLSDTSSKLLLRGSLGSFPPGRPKSRRWHCPAELCANPPHRRPAVAATAAGDRQGADEQENADRLGANEFQALSKEPRRPTAADRSAQAWGPIDHMGCVRAMGGSCPQLGRPAAIARDALPATSSEHFRSDVAACDRHPVRGGERPDGYLS